MLGDAELHSLDRNLKSMVQDNQKYNQNIESLLDQFNSLLESYNRLKSDYEEEKEGRERYKKLARAQERNPFVLVLVDGDGYLFKEHLIRAGVQGGVTAARLLSDSIKELVQEQLGAQADQCQIMVRIYSNILGLSKSLARTGIVGNEARSLSTFASSFTRAQDLFDYIDAGDKKEGADYKIREMFRLFADNNQCKHVFFAGCHDTGYLSLLTPYRGRTDRITLIKAASFHHEYETLNLAIRELPAVFTTNQMGGNHIPPLPPTAPSRPICKHYQKGICRYGSECMKIHIMPNQQFPKSIENMSSPSTTSHSLNSANSIREQELYARYLSPVNIKSRDYIAVNKDGERIDPYSPSPSQDAWDTYNQRAKQHKLCNKYHLGGGCGNAQCDFDHSPINPGSLGVMKHILRQHVCPRGSRCRDLNCYLGHHCQKGGCRGSKPCKFSRHAHTLDLMVEEWEIPVDTSDPESPSGSEESIDVASTTDSKSGNGLSLSPIEISF